METACSSVVEAEKLQKCGQSQGQRGSVEPNGEVLKATKEL